MTSDRAATVAEFLDSANRASDWTSVNVVVGGLGMAGFAAADALLRLNANVLVIDRIDDELRRERANILEHLGAHVQLGPSVTMPNSSDLLIPSPGLPPSHPWIKQAHSAVIWSGEQLAWQLRPLDNPAPWLVVTGTNGKTTTVEMLASVLRHAGMRAMAVGNVGRPLVEAVLAEPAYDVLAVELSSFQLHWSDHIRPHSSALLNIDVDHLDWHGSMSDYVADKARVFSGTTHAIIYNLDDLLTEELAQQADVTEGCRAAGVTSGIPDVGMLGVVDGILVDRAFAADRRTHTQELCQASDLKVRGTHNVSNALAAAALGLSLGVTPQDVGIGLRAFEAQPHRLQVIETVGGVDYVDDSKATNVSAADVALENFDRVVWIAGGLAKGGQFDELVAKHQRRLAAAVLIGTDRRLIIDAIQRHAPEIPVIEVPDSETEPMDHAVRAAASLARPKDTVLLAPACASTDQFDDYAARGDAFAHAVALLRR